MTHASVSVPGLPAIRHTSPGNRRVPSQETPALSSASRPLVTGPGTHRTLTPPVNSWKSITTVIPTLSAHGPSYQVAGCADATAVGTGMPIATSVSAPMTRRITRSNR